MTSLFVLSAAAATVVALAATAAAYVSTPLLSVRGFLSSPLFLQWLAANVIIVWLLSSSRRSSGGGGDSSSAGRDDDAHSEVDDLYYATSDYEGFGRLIASSGGEAPVVVSSKPKRQREAREARAARRTDRARVPKKPAGEAVAAALLTRTTKAVEACWPDTGDNKSGDDVIPTPRAIAAVGTRRWPAAVADDKKLDQETPRTVPAAAAAEARREDGGGGDDVSLDSLWQSMVQRRAVRPVAVRKSETWGNDELPRLQRAAETAARRREMRKSVSSAGPPPQPEAPPPSAVRELGWRTRDVLVRAHDDLLRRAESLIRRHHEQLRLQRQESEQRRVMEQQRGRQPTLIRV